MRLRMVAGAFGAAAVMGGAAVAFASPAMAAGPNPCTGLPAHGTSPVVDAAEVVAAGPEAALAADLTAYHDAGNEAIVAATVHDLGGDDVASYAKRLFTCWGVGDKGSDNGVLILVAMTEHRTRIELGAGLAQRIPDEELSLAVEAMTAPLRQGDVAGGLRAAAVAVADDLGTPLTGGPSGPSEPAGDVAIPAFPAGGGQDDGFTPYGSGGSGFGLAALVPLFILVAIVGAILKALAGAAGNGGTGGGRGWFPGPRGYRYWDAPTMFHAGRWSDADASRTWSSSSMSGSSSASSSMSSSMSSGSSGGSFGGGSSGGGGASGSW